MKSAHLFAAAIAAAFAVTQAAAGPINMVAPVTLTGLQLATFDDVAGGAAPGSNYDVIFVSGGVSFAERFVGQNVAPGAAPFGDFDVLSGTPTANLALALGAAGQNLNVYRDLVSNSQVLVGLGPAGNVFEGIGEGSFAALFADDQSEFGFKLLGGDGGTATLNFFRRDGSLIDSLIVSGLAETSYGFKREGNLRDIAGVSIHNSDIGGIAVDNVRYDVPVGGGGNGHVPEPGSLALAGLALVGLAAARRRRA